MQSNALFLGWNRPIVGREALANELFASWIMYWATKQEAGVIESFEPVILSYHGGDMNGFMWVKGSSEALADLRHSEEFTKLAMQTNHAVQGFGVIDAWHGDSLMELMGQWGEMVS